MGPRRGRDASDRGRIVAHDHPAATDVTPTGGAAGGAEEEAMAPKKAKVVQVRA